MNTSGTIFYNADYVVLEYMDIIKSPYLTIIAMLKYSEEYRKFLKFENIDYLDELGLSEWYINRKHRNPFVELSRYPDEVPTEKMDQLLNTLITHDERFYQYSKILNIAGFLSTKMSEKISNGIIIYDPHESNFAKNDLNRLFNKDFIVMHNFDDILNKTKSNSTYILSDVHKIHQMKKKGCLKFSSVTLPIEYRYNKVNIKDFDLDFDELWKTDPFKLSYFRACSYALPEEEPKETQDE